MNLEALVDAILNSSSEDWTKIERPVFLQDHHLITEYKNKENVSRVGNIEEHSMLYTLKDNLSVSIATGLKHLENFAADWYKKFPDATASSDYVDLMWNGRPVYREIVVWVDGGRCPMPAPLLGTLDVPERKADFFGLLDELGGVGEYPNYFARAGFSRVSARWPD